jgi:integrase
MDMELIDANPAARVPAPKADPREPHIPSPAEYERLLAACDAEDPMLLVFVAVLAECGLRADSEALRLEWSDVAFATRTIHVRSAPGRRTKTGKARRVPITDRLLPILREHAARYRLASYGGQRSPYLFHHTASLRGQVAGSRIKNGFRKAFDRAVEAAGLPDVFRRHDLRHARATTWLAEGRNVVHVKEALGHASLATTMAYTHLADEHVAALLEPAPINRENRATGT